MMAVFFSSRRRHTRFSRDWSSDVCSSDLVLFDAVLVGHGLPFWLAAWIFVSSSILILQYPKIGRASCRERVKISEGAGTLKEKKISGTIRRVISASHNTAPNDWMPENITA